MARVLESDWVVVGGGSAGSVMAARLSEDPSRRVILLEAGADWRTSDLPEDLRTVNVLRGAMSMTEYGWNDIEARRTTAQDARPYPRGRGLGGSSTINGMAMIRPMPADYDRWVEHGCTGWSFEEMLPSLRRLEADVDFGTEAYHGAEGPMPIIRVPQDRWGPVDEALRDAALALGHQWADDTNAPHTTGVSPYAMNARDGGRVSTNDAYLEPIRDRANLQIIGNALVDTCILEGGRSRGVRAKIDGETVEIRAENVVLCAGAVHSPAILLRSGVGPEGSVERLPVGESLRDHPMAIFMLKLNANVLQKMKDPASAWELMNGRTASCCVRFSSGVDVGAPNDLFFCPVNVMAPGGMSLDMGMLNIWLNYTDSSGTLRLASPDPEVQPVIDERLLSEASDLTRMRAGIRHTIDILRSPSFGGLVEDVGIDFFFTPLDALTDDASIDAWLLNNVGDAAHISGTCRMGDPSDATTVVDPSGRVLGFDGLWVADASVFPTVPRANTNLPTIAVAERLAELMTRTPEHAAP